MNNNQNESLLQIKQSSRWQLAEPYNAKKHSVFILLIQIFYLVSFIVLTLLGFFFLIKSSFSSHKSDSISHVVSDWNNKNLGTFSKLKLTLESNDLSIHLSQSKSQYLNKFEKTFNEEFNYEPLYYKAEDITPLIKTTQIKKKTNDIVNDNYNISTSLQLNVSGAIVNIDDIDLMIKSRTEYTKLECEEHKGLYNGETEVCYQYFFLKKICIVIDSSNRSLYYEYKMFKCNQFTRWYQSFRLVKWTFPDMDPTRDDVAKEQIEVVVEASNDPLVWLNFSNEDDKEKIKDYSLLGIWLLIIALGLIILGVCFYFKTHEKKEMRQKSVIVDESKKQKIELSKNTNGDVNDYEGKATPVPNPVLK